MNFGAFLDILTFLEGFGLVSFALSLYGVVVLFFWHRESIGNSDCVHVLCPEFWNDASDIMIRRSLSTI